MSTCTSIPGRVLASSATSQVTLAASAFAAASTLPTRRSGWLDRQIEARPDQHLPVAAEQRRGSELASAICPFGVSVR
jgi:hypothetical protein